MNWKKLFLGSFALILVWLFAKILTTPFRVFDPKIGREIRAEVLIHAPANQVFKYLGDSRNAANWSSFVHHITPLNPSEKQDGAVGALRRCFKNADEKGPVWDEEILLATPDFCRKLSIFNMQNFGFSVENLRTEQRYETLDSANCKLTFSLFFEKEKSDFWANCRGVLMGNEIEKIFKKNLLNIKKINEKQFSERN